jgi:hypothetical protein
MKRFFGEMNPTLRGFLIIALVAAIIVALSLGQTLSALFILARIAMVLAIAYFIYLVWRERRADIAMWSTRAQVVFYGAALVIVAVLLAWSLAHHTGADEAAYVVTIALCAFSMWRVWRDARTYS